MQFTCLENNQFLPGKNRNTGNSNFNYSFGAAVQQEFHEILIFFFFASNYYYFFFVFLNCLDVLISKMNFFKKINYFDTFPSKKHFEKLPLPLSQTPLKKKSFRWKTSCTFPLCESTNNPSKLSPTTAISLRSGLTDVCCKKKTSLVIKLEVEKGIAVIKFHNRWRLNQGP